MHSYHIVCLFSSCKFGWSSRSSLLWLFIFIHGSSIYACICICLSIFCKLKWLIAQCSTEWHWWSCFYCYIFLLYQTSCTAIIVLLQWISSQPANLLTKESSLPFLLSDPIKYPLLEDLFLRPPSFLFCEKLWRKLRILVVLVCFLILQLDKI